MVIEDQIAEGDKVVSRGVMTGTHTGEWKGIPPTGNKINYSFIFIERVKEGKLVERWTNSDLLGLLRQLDLLSEEGSKLFTD